MANQNALDMDKNIKALQRQADWIEKKESRLQNAHRALWLVFFLGALGLLAAVYFVFIDYYFNGGQELLFSELLKTSNAESYQRQLNVLQAQSLRINANYALKNYKGNYDLLSFVYNPNTQWYAEVDFYFQGMGGGSEKAQAIILPSSSRPLWLMDQVGEEWQNARLVLENIVWKRATNYQTLKSEYLNFVLDNIELTDLEAEDEMAAHTLLSFDLINNSVYNFWKVGLGVVLKRYDEVIAFYYFETPQVTSFESRSMTVNLFDEFKAISDTEIIPMINVFDSGNIYRK